MKNLIRKAIALFRRTPEIRVIPAKNMAIRRLTERVEKELQKRPDAMYGNDAAPLKHSFGDGLYVREIFMQKGMLIVSKIHKFEHPYFILKGDVSVLTEEGVVRLKAPYQGMTPVGTKRVLYIHEDTTWITVHATKERDIYKIEEEIIAKDFSEVLPTLEEVKELKKGEK